MKKLLIFASIFIISVVFFTNDVFAQNNLSGAVNQQIAAGAQGAEIGGAVDPRVFVADLIRVMLTAVGTIFTFLIILGGYWWLTDRGEEERVKKAKTTISAAVIGLVVVLISYSITLFVGNAARDAATGKVIQNFETRVKCGIIDAIRGRCDRNQQNDRRGIEQMQQ